MDVRPAVARYADPLVATGLVALIVVSTLADDGLEVWERAVALATVTPVAPLLAARRRAPLALLAAIVAVAVSQIWLPQGGHGEAWGFAMMVAVYTAAAHCEGRRALLAGALTVALALAIMIHDGDSWNLSGVLFFGLLIGTPFVVGRAIRLRRLRETALEERADALARERDERARAAVAEERTRIARELHDVVAHAVSVIVLQARGGRKLLAAEPDEAREAFDMIERTGQQALSEMRRLLGALRADDEELALAPQPSLSRLDELAAELGRAGLPVAIRVDGEAAELPPGVDVSAYRIVQEALTNALRHAGPARAFVAVRYGDGEVELEIADDGGGVQGNGGDGHGLLGIRERVAVHGGDFEAGSRHEGGFAVRARLPFSAAR